jgi:GTPase SAR1 family protein
MSNPLRFIYFSASPLHKTPEKKRELPLLACKAEFDQLEYYASAIADPRVKLRCEFHADGTTEKLQQVLALDKSTPVILVLACHGDLITGELLFADKVDSTLAQEVDANKLAATLGASRSRLLLTVFASNNSTLLAPSIQSVVQLPGFVTFGVEHFSLSHVTTFLSQLVAAVASVGIAGHVSALVDRAKERVFEQVPRFTPEGAFAERILFTGVGAFEPRSASVMRVVYFSASPLYKSADKDRQWDPPTIDWAAECALLQGFVGDRLTLEFHGDGTIAKLAEVLADESSAPTILVLACRDGADERALPFMSEDDREVAEFVRVGKLAAMLRHARRRLALTVLCSGSAGRLAPIIQALRLPSCVTFGADAISVRNSTLFVAELLGELAAQPAGTPLSTVVQSAKKKLQDTATSAGDSALLKFGAQVLLTPLMATRVGDKLARGCGSRDDVAVTAFVRSCLLHDAGVRDAWSLPALEFHTFLESASVSSDEARWLASMQFAYRQTLWRQPARSDEQAQWFERIAELVVVRNTPAAPGDAALLASAAPLLAIGREVPLELYAAVKSRVDKLIDASAPDLKDVLQLLRLVDQMERRAGALGFVGEKAGEARDSVRACVRGAMYEHVFAADARLPTDLTSDVALETRLLWQGFVQQLKFFGGKHRKAVSHVERAVKVIVNEQLGRDEALQIKYAAMPLRQLKRQLPWLLLKTIESSASALDGDVDDKRIKVIVVGDSGVGKTQLRRRLGGQEFEREHKSTDTAEVSSVDVSFLTTGGHAWADVGDKIENIAWGPGMAAVMAIDDFIAAPKNGEVVVAAATAAADEGHDNDDDDDDEEVIVMHSDALPSSAAAPSAGTSVGDQEIDGAEERAAAAGSDLPPVVALPSAAASAVSALTSPSSSSTGGAPLRLKNAAANEVDDRKILSMWDFGGQLEYFAVHDLFLTDGAVFVLVIDWTKGVEAARKTAQVWLDALRAHVKVPVVLPVLTRSNVEMIADVLMTPIPNDEKSDEWKLHTNLEGLVEPVKKELSPADEDSDDSREAKCRRAAYEGMLGARLYGVAKALNKLTGSDATVCVDSADGRNYDELKRKLLALADDQMAASGQVPLRWLQLHDELTELRANGRQFMTRAEFETKLRAMYGPTHVVTEDEAHDALEYSKRVGTVLTCGGERVREFVFLDPELFLQLVRPLINTSEQLKKRKKDAKGNGALSKAFDEFAKTCVASRVLLEHVWAGVVSPEGEDKVDFFVELLEHCGLMCKLRTDDSERGFFVPAASALLAERADVAALESAAQFAFECRTEGVSALPPSLLPRVVASLHNRGSLSPESAPCSLGPRCFEVMLLKSDSSGYARLMRLEYEGARVVVTLAGGRDLDARAWRLDAYVAVYEALTSVLGLVFGSLSLHAATKCNGCDKWVLNLACKHKFQLVGDWRPLEGDKTFARHENWSVVTASATKIVPKTASAMRVVYFSASPLHKTPAKKGEWAELDWKAEFEKVQRATEAVVNRRVALSFEFHDKGTLDELERVLTANSSVPTILVIACHGEPTTGALQFAYVKDGTLAHVIDAGKLKAALERTRHQLALTVFCSCCSSELASSIQHVAHVPCFVTFGTKSISAEHTTLFLTALFEDVVTNSAGAHFVNVVERAKQRLLNLATTSGRPELTTFANKILWSTSTAPRD